MSKIYTEIRSGLGNQLFQFAFGYALAKELNKELVLCPAYFDSPWKYWIKKILAREVRSFRLPLIIKDKFRIRNGRMVQHEVENQDMIILHENDSNLQKIRHVISSGKDVYLKGYWQRPEFFASYQIQLSELIQPSFILSKTCKETLSRIDENFVGIHVRRGDYLTNKSFGACPMDYYNQAIRKISSVIHNPRFVVFTNNKIWVKEHFPKNIQYMIYSNDLNQNTDIEELYVMTKLKSLIISNSTFSWWGAYLNVRQQKKIVCPATWFLKKALQENAGNFISQEWMVIENQLELQNDAEKKN